MVVAADWMTRSPQVAQMPPWTVAEAKAKFSEVIKQARAGPQTITRIGDATLTCELPARHPCRFGMDESKAQPRCRGVSCDGRRGRIVSERRHPGRVAPRCGPTGRRSATQPVGRLGAQRSGARFAVRLLGIDAATADAWGRLIARGERDGRPTGVMDGWMPLPPWSTG
jgi:hypothetical protein